MRSNRTIVLVDDNADDRALTREALADTGIAHEFREAMSGNDLLDLLRGTGPHDGDAVTAAVVLLDLHMQDGDGMDALRALRADTRLRHVPVVMLTTSSAPADVLRSYRLGANAYVVKADSYAEMVESMARCGRYWLDTVELPASDVIPS